MCQNSNHQTMYKRWSMDSLLPIHKVQWSRLKALKVLPIWSKLLVLTLLLASNQANALTFDGAFNFHMNFVREKKIGVDWLDRAKKKDLIENKSRGR